MKRIEIVDSLRGIAILVMLLFHSSYYWERDLSVQDYNQLLQTPGAMIAFVFGKFAGIFAVISGIGYTYSAFHKKETYNTPTSIIVKSIILSGVWIIIVSKIHAIFLNHSHIGDPIHPYPTGPEYHTLVTGTISTGSIQIPSLYLILYRSTALFMIGFSVIWTGIVLMILFRNNAYQNKYRNFAITGIIGTLIILITDPMKNYVRPFWINAIIADKPLYGFLLGILVGDPFPFFPFAGYASYGMLFGMAFYYELRPKYVSIIGLITSGSYFAAGIYLYVIRGYTSIINVFEPPEMELNFIQIGMMILFCTIIYNIHYLKETNNIKRLFLSPFIRRFGLMTLSIFMLEPLLGTVIKVIFLDVFFPYWSSNLLYVIIYTLFLIGIWHELLILWQHYDFIGSWEWINAKAFQILSGSPKMHLNIGEKLNVE